MIAASVQNTAVTTPGSRVALFINNGTAGAVGALHGFPDGSSPDVTVRKPDTNTDWTVPAGEYRWLEFVTLTNQIKINSNSALLTWRIVKIKN